MLSSTVGSTLGGHARCHVALTFAYSEFIQVVHSCLEELTLKPTFSPAIPVLSGDEPLRQQRPARIFQYRV